MQSHFPHRLVLLTALITAIMLCVVLIVSYYSYQDTLDIESTNSTLLSLSGDINLYDEKLSASALLAAYSGETHWIDRYHRIEPLLASAINEALEVSDSVELHQSAVSTDDANRALVAMEIRAFELIEQGQPEQALLILTSDAYQKEKSRYSTGMNNMVHLLDQHRWFVRTQVRHRVEMLLGLVMSTLIIIAVIWLLIYTELRRWHKRFEREQALRCDVEDRLRLLNEELEVRVSARTKQLKENQKLLATQAHHDELTGLSNRRYVLSYLQNLLEQDKKRFSVMLIDLDNFKRINDTLGHSVGDKLLQQAAARLTHCAGDAALVARLGGDEFLIVYTAPADCESEDINLTLAQKILDQFKAPFILSDNHFNLPVSPSIGIALCPENGTDVEELIRNADMAMYEAKASGRNTVCLYSSGMGMINKEHVAMESMLRMAIDAGDQFQLHYQPQIELSSNKIVGVEALIRWFEPEKGLISPNEFIPLAEDSGMILEIGDWVLAEATRQISEWRNHHGIDLNVSINLASQQLLSLQLVDNIQQSMERYDIEPEKLSLEITERSLIGSDPMTCKNLQSLGRLGIKLSLDDFGTGYSALSYLNQYPFDTLKIDRSFIQTIDQPGTDTALVQGIIDMSRSMKLTVIAEGTETLNQCQVMKQLGCDIAQGYYYSKPISAADFIDYFDAHRPDSAELFRRAS